MLKFLVLTFYLQRNVATNIRIHRSEKKKKISRVDASAIYREKISLDLLIFTMPHHYIEI